MTTSPPCSDPRQAATPRQAAHRAVITDDRMAFAQHLPASEQVSRARPAPQPSNPDTGNKLLAFIDKDSVGDERRSQSPKAGSHPGLPEGSCPGSGRHDRPARGHIGAAYPTEASANDEGSRSARWRVARMVTSAYLRRDRYACGG
jgi:hypothetical protein